MQIRDKVHLPPVPMKTVKRADNSIILSAAEPLQEFDPNIMHNFIANAKKHPKKTLYAQRCRKPNGQSGEWEHLSFAQARTQAESIGQWLLETGIGNRDTLLIISGNSIAHAMIRLGAMAAGVTSCPISANYAGMGGAYERLRYVMDLVKPKIIFAEAGAFFDDALKACDLHGTIVISRRPDLLSVDAVPYESLLATPAGDAISARIENADPDAHAAYMLTSGSTGLPKAVILTQRMLGTNMHQAFQVLGHVAGWDDVMLDWLPWSHVSGAFNMLAAAVFGGTLYIDEGKPAPGLIDETIRNLREISVPYFSNVPAGYALLADALETDETLRRQFFRKLRMLLYGGAGLSQAVLDRLQKMAVLETGHPVFITSGYGTTETSSGCMAIFFETDKVGIGLPMPGLEVKLVPLDDRYEVRLRGDNITRGYLNNPEASAEAFDDEGFYKTGDAAKFHDENDIGQGLYFAGRLAEEFKLSSGTWVHAGHVRASLIEALSPAISDLLLCGMNRDHLAVLGVANVAGLGKIDDRSITDISDLLQSPKILAFLQQAFESYNAANPANSRRIGRFAFINEAPSAARHELSDKGTLNQLIAAENRVAEIEALYASAPAPHVLVF